MVSTVRIGAEYIEHAVQSPAMSDVADAADAARLTEFARAFKAAARSVVLYPEAHPAIAATLGRLTQLTSPPLLTAPLRIGVTADSLLLGHASIARPDASIGELAGLLHTHLIGELTVLPGGDRAAWRQFLLLIARAPDAVRADGGVARLWTTMAGRHVELREIDYAEVLRERTLGTAATWKDVVANCLAGDNIEIPEELLLALIDGSTDAEALTNILSDFDREAADGPTLQTRAAALVRLLGGIVRAVTSRAPDQVEPVMRDLAGALGRLTPDMLATLAQQGFAGSDSIDDKPVLQAVLGQMTDGTIASFVAKNAPGFGAPIERVVQAFQSLVIDEDRRERLVSMAHQSASAAAARDAGFEERWQGVAQKLLTQYTDDPYVSDAYARELGMARAQAVQIEQLNEDSPEQLSAWLGTVSTTELRRLDLALMLDLLQIEQEPARRHGLSVPLLMLMEDLLLVGDLEAAHMLVAAVRADTDDGVDASGRREFSESITARLVTPAVMRHIVGHLGTIEQGQFDRAKQLCALLGERLVKPLAEALAVEERTRTRERLTEILIGFGRIGRQQVEQLKSSANPAVRRTAIYLLREFGGSDALPELTELLDDAEPGVQRDAVRAILTIGTDQGYRVLEQALEGGTSQSREAIMQALGSRDERATPLLIYIVEHLDHRGALQWVYARALELLGQLRDPESVPALAAALHRGEWWAPRRTKALRSSAAAALTRVGTPAAFDALEDAASHGSRSVRGVARAHLLSARNRTGGGRR